MSQSPTLTHLQMETARIGAILRNLAAAIEEIEREPASVDLTDYLTKDAASNTYVAKVTGKDLSTNDFTNAYKAKLDSLSIGSGGGLYPIINVTTREGFTITATDGTSTISASGSGTTRQIVIPNYGTWTITATSNTGSTYTKTLTIDAVKIYEAQFTGTRYGYRISKNEANPYNRVEYLYDAVGMTPAAMDFDNGVFNYGSWQDAWFVKDNKPCMLKSDGTVDYYLNPNNYDYKEDGETPSDVANTSYDGNAMAQFPLVWVYRYEDDNFCYEIISDIQYDENYKAYAHTDASGNIKDYFYFSLFGGSGSTARLRSISGLLPVYGDNLNQFTFNRFFIAATANGEGWCVTTWSQFELIRTLLVLIGKSTDAQARFGYGALVRESPRSSNHYAGYDKVNGQFYGRASGKDIPVKVFHVENLWGVLGWRSAGLLTYGGIIYAKMTPEGDGYQIDNVTGYANVGSIIGGNGYYLSRSCNEYGMLVNSAASCYDTQYYPDFCEGSTSPAQMVGCVLGCCAYGNERAMGPFSVGLGTYQSAYVSHLGARLSYV